MTNWPDKTWRSQRHSRRRISKSQSMPALNVDFATAFDSYGRESYKKFERSRHTNSNRRRNTSMGNDVIYIDSDDDDSVTFVNETIGNSANSGFASGSGLYHGSNWLWQSRYNMQQSSSFGYNANDMRYWGMPFSSRFGFNFPGSSRHMEEVILVSDEEYDPSVEERWFGKRQPQEEVGILIPLNEGRLTIDITSDDYICEFIDMDCDMPISARHINISLISDDEEDRPSTSGLNNSQPPQLPPSENITELPDSVENQNEVTSQADMQVSFIQDSDNVGGGARNNNDSLNDTETHVDSTDEVRQSLLSEGNSIAIPRSLPPEEMDVTSTSSSSACITPAHETASNSEATNSENMDTSGNNDNENRELHNYAVPGTSRNFDDSSNLPEGHREIALREEANGEDDDPNIIDIDAEENTLDRSELISSNRYQMARNQLIFFPLEGNESLLRQNSNDIEWRAIYAIRNFERFCQHLITRREIWRKRNFLPLFLEYLLIFTMRIIYVTFLLHPNLSHEFEIRYDNSERYYSFDTLLRLNPTRKVRVGELRDKCTICITDFHMEDVVRSLICYHIFHVKCIDKWFRNTLTCPVCRFLVDGSNVERFHPRNRRVLGALRGLAYVRKFLLKNRRRVFENMTNRAIASTSRD